MDAAQIDGLPKSQAEAIVRVPFLTRLAKSLKRNGLRGVVSRGFYKLSTLREPSRKRRILERHGDVIETLGLRLAIDSPQISAVQAEDLIKGTHELPEVEMTRRFLVPSLPTVELGGSIGVIANLTNRLLERPEAHVVVEASPQVAPILRRNRELNGGKFEILEGAVAYGADAIEFAIGPDCMTGSTKGNGAQFVKVPALSLRSILESRGYGAINLIVDIEGAEVDLVAHEIDVLKDHVKVLVIETHEWLYRDGSTARMLDDLEGVGFRIVDGKRGESIVFAFINDALAT